MKPSPFPAANCSALHTGPAAPRSYPVRCLADLASAYAIREPSGSVRYSLTMRTTKTGKPAGRTRSAEKHEAILTAALELLASQGYVRMTLDQVATAADVSKSTIHLRWKTKADLLTAALATMRMADAPPPSGDIRTDLLAILRDFDANMERVNGMALIGTCLAEEAHTPELINCCASAPSGPAGPSCARHSNRPGTGERSGKTPTWERPRPRCTAHTSPTTWPDAAAAPNGRSKSSTSPWPPCARPAHDLAVAGRRDDGCASGRRTPLAGPVVAAGSVACTESRSAVVTPRHAAPRGAGGGHRSAVPRGSMRKSKARVPGSSAVALPSTVRTAPLT